MRSQGLVYTLALCTFMTSCASSPEAEESSAAQVSFLQVKAAPDSFKGQSIVFGGHVLSARRLKEGTRIEILQLPLDRSGYPGTDLMQSQGRFIAMHKDFLDPATLPYGTRVTVTGEITGSVTLPLDETEYTYPLVDIRHLQVWTAVDEAAQRFHPYMGPSYYGGPYYGGPYGGPYWRPWPYR
jgi:outer membrane lipoprotein